MFEIQEVEISFPTFEQQDIRTWIHKTHFLEKDIFDLVRGADTKCMILSSDLWGYFMHAKGLLNLFDVSFKASNLKQGRLGVLLTRHVYTDAYFDMDKRVLGPGEFVIINDPFPLWKLTGE